MNVATVGEFCVDIQHEKNITFEQFFVISHFQLSFKASVTIITDFGIKAL